MFSDFLNVTLIPISIHQLRELNERLRQEGDLRIVAECRAQQCEKGIDFVEINLLYVIYRLG